MKREHWIVSKEFSERPARPDGTCFYCGAKIGDEHKLGCVIRCRTVKLSITIRDLVFSVPEDWTPEQIEAHYNSGSWCNNNWIKYLNHMKARMDDVGICMCGNSKIKYLGEATQEEEGLFGCMWDEGHLKEASDE